VFLGVVRATAAPHGIKRQDYSLLLDNGQIENGREEKEEGLDRLVA